MATILAAWSDILCVRSKLDVYYLLMRRKYTLADSR